MTPFERDWGMSYAAYRGCLDKFNEATRRLARERGVRLVDLEARVPKQARYIYDIVHLNTAGSQLAAGIVAEELAKDAELRRHVVRHPRPVVHHGEHDPEQLGLPANPAPGRLQQLEEAREGLAVQVVGDHRDNVRVGGRQGVDREDREARGAVHDDHVERMLLDPLHVLEAVLGAHDRVARIAQPLLEDLALIAIVLDQQDPDLLRGELLHQSTASTSIAYRTSLAEGRTFRPLAGIPAIIGEHVVTLKLQRPFMMAGN